MSLTKETINDKIEIVNNGMFPAVQVRQATIVKEDGVEISRNYHRYVVMPGDDHTNLDADVRAVVEAVHTDEVNQAYRAFLESQEV